jgi:hypothetical protein
MALIRCVNGHLFNERRYGKECPLCHVIVKDENGKLSGDARTVAEIEEELLFSREEPVVGWLVCIFGARQGKDYRLHEGKNFIGRADDMDIQILGDDGIARRNHAVLVYDPKKRNTTLLPGESQGIVYLNGEAIYVPTIIEQYAQIEMGRSKFVFMPFCGEHFVWGDEEAK